MTSSSLLFTFLTFAYYAPSSTIISVPHTLEYFHSLSFPFSLMLFLVSFILGYFRLLLFPCFSAPFSFLFTFGYFRPLCPLFHLTFFSSYFGALSLTFLFLLFDATFLFRLSWVSFSCLHFLASCPLYFTYLWLPSLTIPRFSPYFLFLIWRSAFIYFHCPPI